MSLPARSFALLALLLAAVAAAQPVPAAQERRIVLTGEATQAEVLRLAPGVATVLLFEEDLEREAVRWEGPQEALVRFGVTAREILLEPGAAPGEHLGQLQVRFAEGALIESADFAVVLAPAQVDRQVRVVQQPNSPAVWKAALARERALRARCEAASLTALVFAGILANKDITSRSTPTTGWEKAPGLVVDSPRVHRAQRRVALVFRLELAAGARPWAPAEARLTHAKTGARRAVLSTRMDRPRLVPGEKAFVVVEWEEPLDGHFTLEVLEREGDRGLRVPGGTLR